MNPLLAVLLPAEHCIVLGLGRSRLPESRPVSVPSSPSSMECLQGPGAQSLLLSTARLLH